ncbi:thioredoxin family protein [Streptomyces sp. MJM1172]|uniref:thioredoxin family protein n=1 Tax=Streptomyces sp. MJM1172 TaxID=1703926 RepID=UPI0009396F8C|nr:thioredoxin domain-containing protein [Streptomyces sp. MJM1172]OKI62671.1 thioredoxin [Streptomyces sp. MJM1172]
MSSVTDANFQRVVLKSKKPVVVLFTADWCGPCRQVAPRLEGIALQHPELLGAKLNVDENPATATKYGIRSLPAMVVFQNGKVAKTITGVKSTTALEKDLVKFLTKAR